MTGPIGYTGTTTIDGGALQIYTPEGTQATVALSAVAGAGEFDVGSGSVGVQLTADSVSVGTFTVGAGSVVVIDALPGGPAAVGPAQAVPEPSTLLMLILAGSTLAGIYFRRSLI